MKAPEMIIADRPPDVKEIHIVWMTTGLGCDGDSVSITAASLPSSGWIAPRQPAPPPCAVSPTWP